MKKIITLVLALIMVLTVGAFAEAVKVAPQAIEFDTANIDSATLNVSFDPSTIVTTDEGTVIENVKIYLEDVYDIVEVAQIKEGDTLVYAGNDMVVETVERDGDFILINGGIIDGGATLRTKEDSNGWFAVEFDDLGIYSEYGTAALKISDTVKYTDSSDLENGPVEYNTAAEAVSAMQAAFNNGTTFNALDTTVTIENNEIVAINHIYIP